MSRRFIWVVLPVAAQIKEAFEELSDYKRSLKDFEQKYNLSTRAFLKKFEAGQIGDDADYFDWYAFAKLLDQWQKTQSPIRSAIQ